MATRHVVPKQIKALITALGYTNQRGDVWAKSYGGYEITVDFGNKQIGYPPPITLGNTTTSNFSNGENFVVLECIDRLLTKGYPPSSLSLEHTWPVGHKHKGRLDILVKDGGGAPYLMIECKTWGQEYEKEKKRMLKDGGQLFGYYQQDTGAKYLCLYTATLKNGQVDYKNDIVRVEDSFRHLSNVKEIHTHWNKQFAHNGIFEEHAAVYDIQISALTKKDLKPLEADDGTRIYNQFLEILRHNVVSDKGNAFNKIFNLFLCKILDEDRQDDEQTEFQWIEGEDSPVSLLSRLNVLYKKGMGRYLEKDVTDYTEEDIGKKYENDKKLLKMLQELRLYKNQEFAFVDVFNKESFNENAHIVREVVELLQQWRLRYAEKQQFLGEFFELLLNTGFKQESGQFFTPVPLVRFIIKSLPLEDILDAKIKAGDKDFLPYVIDFACGSGHFLTEMMDILQRQIMEISPEKLAPSQKQNLKHYQQGDFSWAKDFIYGIERDYRLVKTTKLACFLHGDGEAKIVHASGLDSFSTPQYRDKLGKKEQFDILVANPPYSVSGFRTTVKDGDASFNLYKHISDVSSEIEILFIERMEQLLKPGGCAAIILPQSILGGEGNYTRARHMIFENFDLKALVLLGGHSFMATGTNTVVMFLKKLSTPRTLRDTGKGLKQDYQDIAVNQSLIVINSGEKDKDAERHFLGYKFSNRRGKEGIQSIGPGLLLDEANPDNPKKVSSYILNAMRNKTITNIDDGLKGHVSIMPLADCFDWDADEFTNSINPKKKLSFLTPQNKTGGWVSLGGIEGEDILLIKKGQSITKAQTTSGEVPVVAGGKDSPYTHNVANFDGDVITISASGAYAGHVRYHATPVFASDCIVLQNLNPDRVSMRYLYFVLMHKQEDLYKMQSGVSQPHVYADDIRKIFIPLPPLKKQQAGVKKLNSYQKKIGIARTEMNTYAPNITIKNGWAREKLKDVARIEAGGTPKTDIKEYWGGNVNWATLEDVKEKYLCKTSRQITEQGLKNSSAKLLPAGTVLFSSRATIGEVSIAKVACCTNQGFKNFICNEQKIIPEFMYYMLVQHKSQIENLGMGSKYPEVSKSQIGEFQIPTPPLPEQVAIVEKLNAERKKRVDTNKELIVRMNERVEVILAALWEN